MFVKSVGENWIVISDHGDHLKSFKTNEEAWRFVDKYQGEPKSRAEETAEYVWRKMYHGENHA